MQFQNDRITLRGTPMAPFMMLRQRPRSLAKSRPQHEQRRANLERVAVVRLHNFGPDGRRVAARRRTSGEKGKRFTIIARH